jgi:hypothetical protein
VRARLLAVRQRADRRVIGVGRVVHWNEKGSMSSAALFFLP